MTINEFIRKYRKIKKIIPGMTSSYCPHVVCKDGFKMSVQAGQSNYSTPKDVVDTYEEMEIGFPSEVESLLVNYCEDESNPCGTVYSFVPVNLIDKIIKKHGGIDLTAVK